MSKLKAKHINLGIGTDQVSDKVIPSAYTPSAYTPTQVDSEGTDKISAHLKGIDQALSSIVPPQILTGTLTNNATVAITGSELGVGKKTAEYMYYINRQNDIDAWNEAGSFWVIRDANDDFFLAAPTMVHEDSGVSFSVNSSTGVISVTTTNIANHDAVESKYRLMKKAEI